MPEEGTTPIAPTTPSAPNLDAEDGCGEEVEATTTDGPTSYKEVPREELIKHLKKTACTTLVDGDYVFPNVLKNCGPAEVGRITSSVGIQLYFEMLYGLGWTFLVMFILTIPMLVCCISGTMVDGVEGLNKVLAMTSIANIGRCPDDGCDSQDAIEKRCMWDGNCDLEGDEKIRDWATWLGLLDSIALLAFMAFGVIFKNVRIPQVVKKFDAATVTPADYTVDVLGLPRELGGDCKSEEHKQYEAKLREHFVKILRNLQQDPVLDADDSCIAKISFVREFNGAVADFMDKGVQLQALHNAKMMKLKISYKQKDEKKKEKKLAKQDKVIEKLNKTIDKYDLKLKGEASNIDVERAVCRAFVTFRTIEMNYKVQNEYRFSRFAMFRCCQNEALKFEKKPLCVQQAVEPNDLYWENLDFNQYKRVARKLVITLVTIIVLILCSVGLVGAKSVFAASAAQDPHYDTWIVQSVSVTTDGKVKKDDQCFRVCDWELLESCDRVGAKNSDDFPAEKLFDPKSDYKGPIDAAGKYWNQSSTALTTTGCWESPGCSDKGADHDDQDWIGITFNTSRQIKCMNIWQYGGSAASELRLWACPSINVPQKTEIRSSWKPEDGCVAHQVMEATTTVNNLIQYTASTSWLAVVKDTSCPANISYTRAETAKEQNWKSTYDCYCQQEVTKNPKLATPPYNTPEKMMCEQWAIEQAKQIGALVFSVVSVLVINQILLFLFTMFVDFLRPQTVTEYTTVQLLMLFISQFINTSLLILLVNSRFPNIPSVLQIITQPLSIGKGEYYEMTGTWFSIIGASLIITVVVQVFSNTLPQILMARLVNPLVRSLSIWMGGAVTKETLEMIYELPEWNISLRVAQTFNVVCTIVFYSSGMPILYIAGAIYCTVGYWIDKYGLLRGSRRPPAYNQKVIEMCMHFIPFAAVLHACLACFLFGNQILFPSEFNDTLVGFAESWVGITQADAAAAQSNWLTASSSERDSESIYVPYIQARWLDFARMGCFFLMLIFVIGVVYYVLYYLYIGLFQPLLSPVVSGIRELFAKFCCKDLCKKRAQVAEHEAEWATTEKDLEGKGYAFSYLMKDNDKYRGAHNAIEHSSKAELARRGTAMGALGVKSSPKLEGSPSGLKAAIAPAAFSGEAAKSVTPTAPNDNEEDREADPSAISPPRIVDVGEVKLNTNA
mmetsp:Transcript_31890/g.105793  ORF Transcript_31890/g.105793 Transcript_31890/m.105793 type:complete len:1179 (-) Transcript_31890:146-3682(-)